MPALEWSDELALDLPRMDDTHQEFVALLQAVEQADDARVQGAWRELVEHTQAHFDQEDRWMAATRFASGNCHSMQHQVVLKIMREGAERAAAGSCTCCAAWQRNWRCGFHSTRRPWMRPWRSTCAVWALTPSQVPCTHPKPCPRSSFTAAVGPVRRAITPPRRTAEAPTF